MSVSILGIGVVSALGSGVAAIKDALQGNAEPHIENETIETADGTVDLPVYRARVEGLDAFVPKRALRRVDPFARMALLSSHLSIADAHLNIEDPGRLGVVFGSGHGSAQTTFRFLDGIIEDGDPGASPTHFANSVHNALASQTSIFLKASGPCSTITTFNHTVSQVLFTAQTWLEQGAADYVLAGFGDEYCDVLGYAAATLRDNQTQTLQPLHFNTCSFLPGEGHVTFLLGRTKQSTPYGSLETRGLFLSVREVNDLLRECSAVFLAANGESDAGAAFQKLELPENTSAHSGWFGSMPLNAAFELATAAVQMQQESASGVQSVICVEYAGKERFNVYEVKKRDSE